MILRPKEHGRKRCDKIDGWKGRKGKAKQNTKAVIKDSARASDTQTRKRVKETKGKR